MALRTGNIDFAIFEIAAGTGMLSTAIELACSSVGMRAATIGYCERESCAAASLVARMEGKTLYPAPIWDDAWTLDSRAWRGTVDCLCAGYPCQPFSTAGKRLGHRDPRHLWPAVRRAIAGMQPRVVFLENVEGHVNTGAGKVLRDIQRLGYRVTAGLFTSAECGASHQRKRLFILGVVNSEGIRCGTACDNDGTGRQRAMLGARCDELADGARIGSERIDLPAGQRTEKERTSDNHGIDSAVADGPCNGQQELREPPERDRQPDGSNADLANANATRLEGRGNARESRDVREMSVNVSGDVCNANGHKQQSRGVQKIKQGRKAARTRRAAISHYAPGRNDFAAWSAIAELDPARMPSIESSLRRVANGLAPWSDQLRLVGNGVDPLAAAYAFLSLWACLRE